MHLAFQKLKLRYFTFFIPTMPLFHSKSKGKLPSLG
jgi:hypothetical protein